MGRYRSDVGAVLVNYGMLTGHAALWCEPIVVLPCVFVVMISVLFGVMQDSRDVFAHVITQIKMYAITRLCFA